MTYKELYDNALWDLEHNKITLGEFEKMIEPLNEEIPKEEKTAKWIFIDNKKIIAKCSNCTLLHDLMYGTRYCPNCGRRMKGE